MLNECQINLNNDLILEKLNSGNYVYCTELLRDEFKLKRNQHNEVIHIHPSTGTIITLAEILLHCTPKLIDSSFNEDLLLLIKQCFQSLRNCCACGKQVQNQIVTNVVIMENSYAVLNFLTKQSDAVSKDCLKMQLQFLCNLIVSNSKAQVLVWHQFSNLLKTILSEKEFAHIIIMILYNILQQHIELLICNSEFVHKIIELNQNNVDNAPLLLELLLTKNVVTKTFNDLSPELRLALLEIIHEVLIEESTELPYDLIHVLVDSFKMKSDCILKTVTDYLHNIEPLEVAKLLDSISCASSKDIFLSEMQGDKSLVITCAFLLKCIHDAGKEGGNNFSAIQKLSELKNVDKAVQEHPGFGFKAALIRLLGNLCSKHKDNQDLVRELDFIPLLMDCCNIDARNPLIIQWVILAMRNLCENNSENQAVVAQMTKVGVINSSTLQEMGLTLHDDGSSKIGVVPLDLNK